MKVLMINGSPHEFGSTYTALKEISDILNSEGIETEIFYPGVRHVSGCITCGYCSRPDTKGCSIKDDAVNTIIEKARDSDGFVFGSPVHYASSAGALSALLDRCFYAGSEAFAFKPGAAVASCRRGGSTATLDQLNKYFTITNMPVVSSQYWNMVHGHTPEEVKQDLEGMQVMRGLGRNMAWLLKCIEAGQKKGIGIPEQEKRAWTNFIR